MTSGPTKPVGKYLAVRITVIYAIVAGLWILLSDYILGLLFPPDSFSRISIIKGWGFVLVTSLLLYSLIRSGLEALRYSENTLVDSERRLSDIISFLPDATLVIDKDGKVIAWNKAMEEITGVRAEQMLGKGDYEYSIPFYGHRQPLLIDLVLSPELEIGEGYEILGYENHVLVAEAYLSDFRPGGTYLWVKATPLCDSRGNVVGAVQAFRDISDRKRAEEERRLTEERERRIQAEAEEAKRQFYQRTIFSVTGGRLNLVDHAEIDAIMNRDAEFFDLKTVDDMSRVRENVTRAGEQAGMSAERIYALVTAVGEAAANAVKHADGGIVALSVADSRVRVCVRDHGSGMDQLMLPKATLLARFSTKASMGLGYSLILGLVDTVYLATDTHGTSVLMEQSVNEPMGEISLETLPDTW